MKFYLCEHCKQIVTKEIDRNVPIVCCGEKMKELLPNTTDAANEKHVPVVEVEGNLVKVSVGSVTHPMTPEHSIQFIAVETTRGSQIRHLEPTDKPYAEFVLAEGEELVRAYEYCNLHGLWATK